MDGKRIDELAASYNAITRVASGLEERDFLRVTRCVGWAVCDLLFHVLLDAQRALIAFATPAEGPADVDFVSYWEPFSSEDADSLAHARFVRISASAHHHLGTSRAAGSKPLWRPFMLRTQRRPTASSLDRATS